MPNKIQINVDFLLAIGQDQSKEFVLISPSAFYISYSTLGLWWDDKKTWKFA